MIAAGSNIVYQQFTALVQFILLIVPTSAGSERLFSQMGIVHTNLRNRLTTNSSCKVVQLKMDVQSHHLHKGLISLKQGGCMFGSQHMKEVGWKVGLKWERSKYPRLRQIHVLFIMI